MKMDKLGTYFLSFGVFAWIWNLFAPDNLGGYQYLFSTDFSISNLKYGELWDSLIFIIVGALAIKFKESNKIWWLELGLLLSYLAKFVVLFAQDITPQTWVTSFGFTMFVAHFATQGNPKNKLHPSNKSVDRIAGFLALIPLLTMILGWSLPFVKHTYQTNGTTTFSWNGQNQVSTTCCTAFESDWQSNVISLSRYFWMFMFLILLIIGIKVSKTVFATGLIFTFYSVVSWISGLGMQKVEPDESWTQEMIDSNHLTHNVSGMPGGYIFSISLFALFAVLLFPTVVKGAQKESEAN